MAGSEKYGPQHAMPDLYEGSVVLVSPHEEQAADAYKAVCDLWRAVGARVVDLPPDLHDVLLARTSHVPHIVAALLAELGASCGERARDVVGAGFRDVTRVAAGRPEVWRDICLTNREAILEALDEFVERLRAIRDQIDHSAAEQLEAAFEAAQAARARALGE
jgi:prephenate dehydrogenase